MKPKDKSEVKKAKVRAILLLACFSFAAGILLLEDSPGEALRKTHAIREANAQCDLQDQLNNTCAAAEKLKASLAQ